MSSDEHKAAIVRLYHVEKWRIGTIARELSIHHSTVRRILEGTSSVSLRKRRPTKLDPYLPFIHETLERFPRLHASRLYAMCLERGYIGCESHFRFRISQLRPRKPSEAFLRLKTLPGEQAQVDWGHFGKLTIGEAKRPLMAFVMILSFSRRLFVHFFPSASGENFLRGHELAFADFGGTSRVVLYDNLKSAVLERRGNAIHFHPRLLDFAAHYRFEPRPVAVARGNEKGRVERAIRYVRTAFWPARTWKDLADLNEQALTWCHTRVLDRPCPEHTSRTVREVFEEERERLLPLPETSFPTEEVVAVSIGKTPYARFDGNDYSVPHTHVRRTLELRADLNRVRLFEGERCLAEHQRSFDRKQQIEDPRHVDALWSEKREAREHRSLDRLTKSCPSAEALFVRLADRGANLGSMTTRFLALLDTYGAAELETALKEALPGDALHHHAVRQILERRRKEKGQKPPLPVQLPENPKLRGLSVSPHSLSTYDDLTKGATDEDQ